MGKLKYLSILKQVENLDLKIRIPGWAQNEALPGGLYKFTDQNTEPVKLMVNGKVTELELDRWICCDFTGNGNRMTKLKLNFQCLSVKLLLMKE